MAGAPGEERNSKWSFTETLSLEDVEIRERQQVEEDGQLCVVPYAHSIQGRETARITYQGLRKVCVYLGVRYYKNRCKDFMTELIAQKKLKGQVPESYKNKRKAEKAVELKQQRSTDRDEDVENRVPEATTATEKPPSLLISAKRQRVATDESDSPTVTNSASGTNMFLQPVSPAEEDRRHSPPTAYATGIPTTPSGPAPPRTHVDMSLSDRVDTFTLLRHIRQQIQHVEDEIVAHTASDVAQVSTVKTQRLTADLQFYLAERRALIQQLEDSRQEPAV
ncbi:Retinoblastoma-like protein 1 [Phytophthora pseudosyringae]|uniref:Retinoblastoma-like protein 1 n=1 Tax=Phytophthora pseudosyringae TaxID=221518 RepID=A0A8T1W8K6_9STRA|nr:Retinoblastoma-like protein 1 [Phytophthora pseudosyringae]